jgi:cyclopropane-fatty-acyl-phospholipid synthase
MLDRVSLNGEASGVRVKSLRRPLAALIVRRLLACVETGRLTIVLPSGVRVDHPMKRPGIEATMVVHRWRVLRRLVSDGDVGLAEAYVAGDWSSPDLAALIALVAENGTRIERFIGGLLPVRVLNRIRHLLRANTKAGSRKSIAFHYDLGNAFYAEWLDRSMTYSSALYAHPSLSLEDAQAAKLDRVVALLAPSPGTTVLEIGCGWGALAERIARQGAVVTGITLSAAQLEHAKSRIVADIGARLRFAFQDYRDTQGTFDRIVSIEMLEAVGEAYWPVYFATLRDRLAAGGKAVLQVITIHEDRYETYRKSADFIQRHIFPGGMLPSKAIFAQEAARAGLAITSKETFGDSYALTLAEWRRRFLNAWPTVEKLGFAPSFRRLWEYYLCYCEAGFRTGAIDVGLYTLEHEA